MSSKADGMWGGRFEKGLKPEAIELSYSLWFDARLFDYDIRVNKAHVSALGKSGYLNQSEEQTLLDALDHVASHVDEDEIFEASDEDVHSFVERQVVAQCGDLGKKMHTGKSRNDQVITDLRLFLKEQNLEIQHKLMNVIKVLVTRAEETVDHLFPGFTHFQAGQPIMLAHHLMAYAAKFERDLERFQFNMDSLDVCPLGSGALAGNAYAIDREAVAKSLGFGSVSANSMDAVSDRDFLIEYCSISSLCMTHLSRFCEELVLWSSPLLGFIRIGDDYTTGSSLMPQKKNPDIAELIRGKSGRVLGNLVALQHILKALPLTYNRDLQEDKEITFDTVDTLHTCLACFSGMVDSIEFQTDRMRDALEQGHVLATDFADYLVHIQIPFREAHEITGKVVQFAESKGCEIHELSLADFQLIDARIQSDVSDWLTMEGSVERKSSIGGTAPKTILDAIKRIKERYKW